MTASIVGAAVAGTALMMVGQQKVYWPASPNAEAVAHNDAVLGKTEEADMALTRENTNSSGVVPQTMTATPDMAPLNSGTGDLDERGHQTAAHVRATASATRPVDNDASAIDSIREKRGKDRPLTKPRPTQNYQDLRDYMLTR